MYVVTTFVPIIPKNTLGTVQFTLINHNFTLWGSAQYEVYPEYF